MNLVVGKAYLESTVTPSHEYLVLVLGERKCLVYKFENGAIWISRTLPKAGKLLDEKFVYSTGSES